MVKTPLNLTNECFIKCIIISPFPCITYMYSVKKNMYYELFILLLYFKLLKYWYFNVRKLGRAFKYKIDFEYLFFIAIPIFYHLRMYNIITFSLLIYCISTQIDCWDVHTRAIFGYVQQWLFLKNNFTILFEIGVYKVLYM